MQTRFFTAAMFFALNAWAVTGMGQDVLDDLFPEDPGSEAAAPADDSAPSDSPLDDLFSNELTDEAPATDTTDTDTDTDMEDLLSDPPPAPRDATDQAIDELFTDEPASPAPAPADTPVPDLFPTDEPQTPAGPSREDLFPGDENGTPNVDVITPPMDHGTTDEGSMDKGSMDKMDKSDAAAPSALPSASAYTLGPPTRPYYSANGVYDRIILFDRHRFHANPAMPFYAVDGGYTGEVLNNDGHLLFEDHQRNPNLWPWGVYYSYPNWTVPFAHREFGGPSGHYGGIHEETDWKSFADHQLNDFRTRKRKAHEINSQLAERPELNKLGNSVDWQEHSWSQMHDVSKRLEYANRLKEQGVRVDYRKYTPEQLLNFLSRVRLAQKLDKLGCKVNWRLYSWRQLHNLLMRAEQADDLMSKYDDDEVEATDEADAADASDEGIAS